MPYRYKGFGATRNPGVSVSAPATVSGDPGPNIPGVMNLGGGNGRLISSQPSMSAGANSGQGLTDTRGLVLLPVAVTPTVNVAAASSPTAAPQQSGTLPGMINPFSDPWFLGYVAATGLALFAMKGNGKLLAAVPALLAASQYNSDTTGAGSPLGVFAL